MEVTATDDNRLVNGVVLVLTGLGKNDIADRAVYNTADEAFAFCADALDAVRMEGGVPEEEAAIIYMVCNVPHNVFMQAGGIRELENVYTTIEMENLSNSPIGKDDDY